ncbi:MAG: helix-turn-helix transcriptional regulator [Gammaproteobacteria bacterium]|nr:helix-turn-helix transcriptional regulator [Gammaproteobacteria bacterium]
MKKISFKEIPSYKYRHFIKKLTKPFYKISYFSGTTVAIFLKTGEMAWLSTTPKTSLKIFATGLHRGDLLLQPKHNSFNRVVFPEEYTEIDETQSAINAILKNDKLYRGYCIVRACDDCSIMITCNVNTESINHRSFYEDTIDYFEKCINDFLDNIISIYSELLPGLAHSKFALDANYRHQMITARYVRKESLHLNDAELDVLYWSAQGKSATEIALITGFTKNTVDTYRHRLMEKLAASNITQAVYIASKSGFIA